MAYETYSTVSWSDGTPISSDRLQQMSSNIDLVKTVTDNYARGVLSYKSSTAMGNLIEVPNDTVLITLDNQGAGLNYLVTAAANRFVKITFNTPGMLVTDNLEENYNHYYRLYPSTDGTGTSVAEWNFGMPGQDAMTGASAIVTDNDSANQTVLLASGLTAMIADKKIGGGTYSVMVDSGATGLTTQAYSITVGRSGGTADYKRLDGAVTQLYAEDCGASV
jgi:hypothetical protein